MFDTQILKIIFHSHRGAYGGCVMKGEWGGMKKHQRCFFTSVRNYFSTLPSRHQDRVSKCEIALKNHALQTQLKRRLIRLTSKILAMKFAILNQPQLTLE